MKVILKTHQIGHLISRATERGSNASEVTPEAVFNEIKEAIETNAPSDWRFTENPAAEFMVTYVEQDLQIKIAGRTYRETLRSDELFGNVMAAVHASIRTGNPAPDRIINNLAHGYLSELADPQAEICHELKTVLAPGMIPRSEATDDRARHPHLMLQDSSRVDLNLKKRPNALVLREANGDLELWVRQGHPYLSIRTGQANAGSHCIFGRLTPNGVLQEGGAVWKFDSWGIAMRVGDAACGLPSRHGNTSRSTGSRGKSYWDLPTYLDARHNDACFSVRETERNSSKPSVETISRIEIMERLYDQARAINAQWIVKNAERRRERLA